MKCSSLLEFRDTPNAKCIYIILQICFCTLLCNCIYLEKVTTSVIWYHTPNVSCKFLADDIKDSLSDYQSQFLQFMNIHFIKRIKYFIHFHLKLKNIELHYCLQKFTFYLYEFCLWCNIKLLNSNRYYRRWQNITKIKFLIINQTR